LGYTLDVGYSHFFNPEWGLSLGLGAQSLSSLSTLNYQSVTPNQVDVVGDSYEFRANYKNWQEKQQGVFFDIPLAVQYRHFLSGKFGLLASGGAKISIPVRSNYKTGGGEIVTTGYYSKWNVELSDLPPYGFSTFRGSYKGNLSLKPSYSGIFDLGALYKLSPKVDVYLGGYLNYGLNNIITRGSKLVYEPDGTYTGFLGSDQVKKVIPIAFGIKAGLYWKLDKTRAHEIQESEIIPKKPVDAGLDFGKQKDILLISDEKGDSESTITHTIQNSTSNSSDDRVELTVNVMSENSVTKVSQQQESESSENVLNNNMHIISSKNFNLKSDLVSGNLQSDSTTLDRNAKILKENSITPPLALSQLDNDSFGSSTIDKKKDLPIKTLNVDVTAKTKKSKTDEKSMEIDSDGDGIPDYLDMCPHLVGVASNQGCPEIKAEFISLFIRALTEVKFDIGKTKFKKKSRSILDQIAKELIKNSNYLIELHGYTDSKGNSKTNKLLSELRASTVRKYLIRKGVDGHRIKSIGYGDKRPISSNNTMKGRSLNRRVEFILTFE